MIKDKPIPKMPVGRYVGVPVDQLPNSYLRFIVSQKFPKEIMDCAHEKLKQSDYNSTHLEVSRHAIDMFSKRFLFKWIQEENQKGDDGIGLATYIVKRAEEAWEKGTDVSKYRHENDGIIREYRGIKWVFNVSLVFPEYRSVVTVMSDTDEIE